MSEYFKHYSFDKWIYKSSSSSTNVDLVETVSKNDYKTNIVLYTYMQTAGKGQIGRKWYSGAYKNLTFSLQFNLNSILAHNQFNLNMICSLALTEVLAQIFPLMADKLTIKWPNDIYYSNKKLAGILIQNTIQGNKIQKMIFGLGLNVNELDFPKDLPNPISLAQITGTSHNLQSLFRNLLSTLTLILKQLDQMTKSELLSLYHSKMYLKETLSKFEITETGESLQANIRGVTDHGQLLLENEQGIRKFNFREIRYC